MSATNQHPTNERTTNQRAATAPAAKPHRPPSSYIQTFTKRVLNPVMMLVAGRKYWYAGVIRHTGRRSGRAYANPVVADRVEGGFIMPLPYGTGVDWLRNLQAADGAVLQVKGERYEVTRPQIIDAATAFPQVPARHARVWRRLGIEHYVKVAIRS